MSLDAYRGAIMLLMASGGLELSRLAKNSNSSAMQFLGHQCAHAEWAGCTVWDLIQPSFMFMVGVALPWSVANRRAQGQPFGSLFAHALWRSLLLVLLAVFLTSAWSKQTDWVFTNVLAQIGLGYPFLFLLAFARPRTQWVAAFTILIGYWTAFVWHAHAHDQTLAAAWDKNANFASSFDLWFLNLFPRATPYTLNDGGYQTLNFVPSLATMIFGLLAGQWLRSAGDIAAKLPRLVAFGAAGVALGWMIDGAGLCPLVKRIWTPSWAIFSTGWAALLLAGFVAVIDLRGWRRWAFPLVVAGMNPIALYVMWQLSSGFIRGSLKIHLGQDIFASFGPTLTPTLERAGVLITLWLVLLWMHRRKIFIRL